MNRSEVTHLYSNRKHRRCVDTEVFSYWTLTNWQSDDAHMPLLAQIAIDTISEIRDERVFTIMWDFIYDEARERTNWN